VLPHILKVTGVVKSLRSYPMNLIRVMPAEGERERRTHLFFREAAFPSLVTIAMSGNSRKNRVKTADGMLSSLKTPPNAS
jgi:hypothetical protein